MAKTAQDVMQLIREQGIKMVDFKMVDINGQYRHVTIPAQNFTEATMTDGHRLRRLELRLCRGRKERHGLYSRPRYRADRPLL